MRRQSLIIYIAAGLCPMLLAPGVSLAQTAAATLLSTPDAVLYFPSAGAGQFGVDIHELRPGGSDAFSAEPVQMLVCTDCTDETVNYPFTGVSYSAVSRAQGGVLASAMYSSPNGSVFHVSDFYSVAPAAASAASAFVVKRTVSVMTAASATEDLTQNTYSVFRSQ